MTYIATFYSHFGAIRFKKLCATQGWNARVMPVPRDLSSSCGTCVRYEGTDHRPSDDIPEEVKQERLDHLMLLQERISAELCTEKVGKNFKVIIDRREGDYFVGRTEHDSPEVDCEVLIHKNEGELQIGSFYNVTITAAEEYDLYGVLIQ